MSYGVEVVVSLTRDITDDISDAIIENIAIKLRGKVQ